MNPSKLYKKYKYINFNPVHKDNIGFDNLVSMFSLSSKPQQPKLAFKKNELSDSYLLFQPNITRFRLPYSSTDIMVPIVGASLFMSNVLFTFPIYPIYVDYITVFILLRNAFKSRIVNSLNKEITEISLLDSSTLHISFNSGKDAKCLIKDFILNREAFEVSAKANKVFEEKIMKTNFPMKSHINIFSCLVNGESCFIKLDNVENTMNHLSSKDICDYDMLFYLLREDVDSITI